MLAVAGPSQGIRNKVGIVRWLIYNYCQVITLWHSRSVLHTDTYRALVAAGDIFRFSHWYNCDQYFSKYMYSYSQIESYYMHISKLYCHKIHVYIHT